MCVRSNVIPSGKPTWQWIVGPSKIDNAHLPLPFCWNGMYFAATREEEVWYTPGNSTIRHQKWPYSKAVTFSKSIILGIQLSVFGGVDSSSIPILFEISPPHGKKGSWLHGSHDAAVFTLMKVKLAMVGAKEKIQQESPTTQKRTISPIIPIYFWNILETSHLHFARLNWYLNSTRTIALKSHPVT